MEVHARAAVVALPINTLTRVDFQPPVDAVAQLATAPQPGRSVKLWITARNVSGVPRLFDAEGLIVYARLERRLPDGEALLVAFGCDATLQTASIGRVQDALAALVPGIEVTSVDTYDWNVDPWSRGTWFAAGPGQMEQTAELAAHEDHIAFAGGDLSLAAPGTIEGAIETAKAAAARITALLA
ncbi:FAD-dependent oxidoreductase [Streptomyces canus]|uniref:FAD-dependent oxidoreductase n=1 Tax=Streptomyces canus TaxID=58343 RepID=UPI0037FD7ABA